MTSTALIFFFVLGAVIGSFLNVVILRYNTGRAVSGRSACASCGKKLLWHELIPIVSFIILRGRCRTCKSAISIQYPIVETLTAVIFSFIGCMFLSEPVTFMRILFASYQAVIWSLLIVISAYDMRHKIIPSGPVYAFIGLSTLSLFGFPDTWGVFSPSHFFTGIGLALFPATLWLVSRGRWMGLGDAKILLGVGFILGLSLGISALIYAFWIGAAMSLSLLSLRDRTFTMKSEIPFGPFIVLGTAIAYFFRLDLFAILLF